MTDKEALFRSILLAPKEDTPRLMYADMLEENGNPRQAEFIRVQIELSRHPGCQKPGATVSCRSVLWRSSYQQDVCEACARYYELRQKEHSLTPRTDMFEFDGREIFVTTQAEAYMAAAWPAALVTRGWISQVKTEIRSFLTFGAELLAEQPIQWVGILDRRPFENAWGDWAWDGRMSNNSFSIPAAIHRLIVRHPLCLLGEDRWSHFRTFDSANIALSDALVTFMRKKNKLTDPLPAVPSPPVSS